MTQTLHPIRQRLKILGENIFFVCESKLFVIRLHKNSYSLSY